MAAAAVGPPDMAEAHPTLAGLTVHCVDEAGVGKLETRAHLPNFQTVPDPPPDFSGYLETSVPHLSGKSQAKQWRTSLSCLFGLLLCTWLFLFS